MGLAAIAVFLALLSVANSPFEKGAIAALSLIYIAVNTRCCGLAMQLQAQHFSAVHRYLEIRSALGRPSQSEELESLNEQKESHKKLETKLMVSMFFDGIIGLFAMLQLIVIALD